jgi:(2Fe-2S) ferredoxin
VRHLFVCTNTIASGKPACGGRGGAAVVIAVQSRLIARGAAARVTSCGCLGPCFDGPNAVVYPEGVWYGALDESDADALVEHLITGRVHEAKRTPPPGSDPEP